MTEGQWGLSDCVSGMLNVVSGRTAATARKLRLFAVSACRKHWAHLPNDQCRHAVEAAERFADGLLCGGNLRSARQAALRTEMLILAQDFEGAAWARVVADVAADPVVLPQLTGTAPLLRDIFGSSPFRPVPFDSAWLTSDVIALAGGIYEDRAFDRMPILADALMDAGCDNDEVLNHCRGQGPHVRGCWVIDLLLGKE